VKFDYKVAICCLEGLGATGRRYNAGYVYFYGKSFTEKISHFLCFSSEGVVVLNTLLTFLVQQRNILALGCWFVQWARDVVVECFPW